MQDPTEDLEVQQEPMRIVELPPDIRIINENSFGGRVATVPARIADQFYLENKDKMDKTGKTTFLRTLGIPVPFFEMQPENIQSDLLTSQKSFLAEKDVNDIQLLLNSNTNIITYASPAFVEGAPDPSEYAGLSPDRGAHICQEDIGSGYLRYRIPIERDAPDNREHYIPTVFVNMPIFYSRDINISVGLYRLLCTNGAVDNVVSRSVKIRAKDFTPSFFKVFLKGVIEALVGVADSYRELISFLSNKRMNSFDVSSKLIEMMDQKVGPKTLVIKAQQHLDLLEKGKQVPRFSPEKQENALDFFDLLTYYAARLPSLNSEVKAAEAIFAYMMLLFRNDLRNPVRGIDADALYADKRLEQRTLESGS